MLISSTSENKPKFKIAPAGSHLGRLYRIIDLGTQKTMWEGQEKQQRKLKFFWELFGEDNEGNPLTNDDGKPLIQTKNYTYSFHEKSTLRKDLKAWRGKDFTDAEASQGFDISTLLGKFFMVNIAHNVRNGDTYADCTGIGSVPSMVSKTGLPEGVNEIVLLDLGNFSQAAFDKLSTGLKDTIMKSPEYQKANRSLANIDSDVPF